jgi:hypothetical protein
MRKGFKNGWLLNDQGRTIGINLGADYTAEHEWGIEPTQTAFGLAPKKDVGTYGIKRRTITKLPDDGIDYATRKPTPRLAFHMTKEKEPRAALIFCSYDAQQDMDLIFNSKMGARELYLNKSDDRPRDRGEQNLATAWSDSDFGILVRGKNYCNRLKEIYDAILKFDAAIWIGGGQVFQNGRLIIAIVSRCPKDGLDKMEECDREIFALKKAANDSGIYDLLKKSDKGYYALSPKQWNKEKPGEPLFWLNPMEQNKYNYGWFTLEDLRQWAEDKGPIMMEQKV